MFENLTERLSKTLRHLTGTAKLTADNIASTLDEIRKALLDADVALAVVDNFINDIKTKALGQVVGDKLSPGQFFIKIVNEELTQLMGEKHIELQLKAKPPVVILMVGLQGSGKTTTVAKLAKYLREKQHKKVMVASCDIYRPAAIEQLKTVAGAVQVNFFATDINDQPKIIAQKALDAAKKSVQEVLIVDTAGRLHIDEKMMQEVQELHQVLAPTETLFVIDSMAGQDAIKIAKTFDSTLPLTGVILTKIDGDARGGAALTVRHVTGKPIKFLGVGEKLDALEPFYPDRIASRILGMGDVLSLIEDIEHKVDKNKAEKLARKVAQGQDLNLEDFREQLVQMTNMGGVSGMLDKLPGMPSVLKQAKDKISDKKFVHLIAMIDSMTPRERRRPDLIKGSRKQRIAKGSGRTIQEVSQLLRQHEQMRKMLKKFSSKGGMMKLMRGLQGRLPPGMFGKA